MLQHHRSDSFLQEEQDRDETEDMERRKESDHVRHIFVEVVLVLTVNKTLLMSF